MPPLARSVALHAGAWIETSERRRRPCMSTVALHAGAWIETTASQPPRAQRKGRPPCGGVDRNHSCPSNMRLLDSRPPCGGVDRNCWIYCCGSCSNGRPPCGGVDRNLCDRITVVFPVVALHAGAWIETRTSHKHRKTSPVALHAGAWIETRARPRPIWSAPSRPPCGGVDRNFLPVIWIRPRPVALHAGAWIETSGRAFVSRYSSVALHAGAWIETAARYPDRQPCKSRPPCGGVDRNGNPIYYALMDASRPPCGGVDRNTPVSAPTYARQRRPPCGGVDRNSARS